MAGRRTQTGPDRDRTGTRPQTGSRPQTADRNQTGPDPDRDRVVVAWAQTATGTRDRTGIQTGGFETGSRPDRIQTGTTGRGLDSPGLPLVWIHGLQTGKRDRWSADRWSASAILTGSRPDRSRPGADETGPETATDETATGGRQTAGRGLGVV